MFDTFKIFVNVVPQLALILNRNKYMFNIDCNSGN